MKKNINFANYSAAMPLENYVVNAYREDDPTLVIPIGPYLDWYETAPELLAMQLLFEIRSTFYELLSEEVRLSYNVDKSPVPIISELLANTEKFLPLLDKPFLSGTYRSIVGSGKFTPVELVAMMQEAQKENPELLKEQVKDLIPENVSVTHLIEIVRTRASMWRCKSVGQVGRSGNVIKVNFGKKAKSKESTPVDTWEKCKSAHLDQIRGLVKPSDLGRLNFNI